MAQTTYALEMTATGYEGGLADSRDSTIAGFRNDSAASAEIPFGRGVSKSSDADNLGCKLPAPGEIFLGVMTHSMDHERTTTGLPALAMGAVLSKGRVWVKVEAAVTLASAVLIRTTSAGNGLGSFTTGSASAGVTTLIPNARYVTAADAGGLAILELNMPAVPVLTT